MRYIIFLIFDLTTLIIIISVPSAVVNLRSTKVGKDNIDIQWEAPNKTNGVIVGAQITYTMEGGTNTNQITVNGTTRTYKLTCLLPYTKYVVTVAEKTSAGFGPNTSVEVTTSTSSRSLLCYFTEM